MTYLKKITILLFNSFLILLCQGAPGDKMSATGVINLAHRHSKWTPLMHIAADLSEVKSIRSYFQFRTLDPEGAIFYGDTKNGQDWFVLSLRDGIPEMQIGKADILVSVKGGRKLNDGAWYLLELRSEGKFVVLEVNNEVELVVGLHSKLAEEDLTGKIRLALGGLLVDKEKLFHPFEPEMDACIRSGHWLNLSRPWDTDKTWEPRGCFSKIKKGSYFPGTGTAMFNTTDLPGLQKEEDGITIEIFGSWTGITLSLKSTGFLYVLGENDGSKDIKDEPKTLTFTILKNSLLVNNKPEEISDSLDFFSMWKQGMLLTFGGKPEDSVGAKGTQYLRGCLEKITVQGQVIDLDRALYKHIAVSSHSCPAEGMNELTS